MSEEQAVEYVVEERDLNLEPEKFHIVKQAFRVLTALPAYLIIKIRDRIKTRKIRKDEKKEIKKANKARKARWRKAFVQRVRSRFAKIATVSKNFKHDWNMAGMTEEEKKAYMEENGLLENKPESSRSTLETPATPGFKPAGDLETPAAPGFKPAGDLETSEEKEHSSLEAIPMHAQGSYISYAESTKTIETINKQIRIEILKGSAADFNLINKYRKQLKIEEMNRDNHLEAYIGLVNGKVKTQEQTVSTSVNEQTPVTETVSQISEPTPRVSSRLNFGSAVQRVAKRALVARGTTDIARTMKSNVLKAKKQVVAKAKALMEHAQVVLTPMNQELEESHGLKM